MTLTPDRLRRLIRHRERLERLQEEQFAAARRATAAREGALRAALDEREAALAAGVQVHGTLDVALLAAGSAHLVRARKTMVAREAALRHSRNSEQIELDGLLARRRDRRAIETLLEARNEAERERRDAREARRLDEFATRDWQWRRTASSGPGKGALR